MNEPRGHLVKQSLMFLQTNKNLTEFDKDILLGIKGDILKVLANQNLDRGFVPVFGDILAHQVRLWGGDRTVTPLCQLIFL